MSTTQHRYTKSILFLFQAEQPDEIVLIDQQRDGEKEKDHDRGETKPDFVDVRKELEEDGMGHVETDGMRRDTSPQGVPTMTEEPIVVGKKGTYSLRQRQPQPQT